jgi:hypothetical protein
MDVKWCGCVAPCSLHGTYICYPIESKIYLFSLLQHSYTTLTEMTTKFLIQGECTKTCEYFRDFRHLCSRSPLHAHILS